MLGKSGDQVPVHEAAEARARPAVVLSVAGFDPCSGAGMTADLQTFAAHRLFGTAAITALTVQSTRGVFEVQAVDAGLLARMLTQLWEDLPPSGIKLGMLASAENVHAVADWLRALDGERPPVVLDPVLRSSSGRELLPVEGVEVMLRELLPLVDWITPNWVELAVLSGCTVSDHGSVEDAMVTLSHGLPHLGMVATGGDAKVPVDLLRLPGGEVHEFVGSRIETRSTHGTGCAFSSALLANLVHGSAPAEAVAKAKQFVEGALRQAPGLGSGRGPMNLLWSLQQGSAGARPGSATLRIE